MKYFFWIAFAVFLAASIPHVAYFFASFEPSNGPEGIWWWAVSYAIAISIDVTVYLLSWTAFQRYRKYKTARSVWQHWLLILMCTFFSWAVNWAYAKQFHSTSMLNAAEETAPWLTNVFPFMASSFPLLGIVYTMMAETITESTVEKKSKDETLSALSILTRQSQLPVPVIQPALSETPSDTLNSLLTGKHSTNERNSETREAEKIEVSRPITAQFVELDSHQTLSTESSIVGSSHEGSPDKLQMTIEALKAKPDMTDEALAEFLSLKRPASARFWRLKAIEILNNTPDKEVTASTASVRPSWATSATLPNGVGVRR